MYSYSPLDSGLEEIRLLVVQPRAQNATYDDLLRGSIRHISLKVVPPPEYETISYVWGNPQSKGFLLLDGWKITIPANAAQALRCLCWHGEARERTLWIDTICIDQTNMTERAQQVAIMNRVYQSSIHNNIYIGANDGTVGNAILSFHNIFEEARRETDGFKTFWNVVFHESPVYWLHDDTPLNTEIDTVALFNFYSRPWF